MNRNELPPESRRIAQLITEALEEAGVAPSTRPAHRSGTYPRTQPSLLDLDNTNTNNSRVA